MGKIRVIPRWLYILTVATVVVSALLLLFGELVTTIKAGMADPDWPTRPWHLALESKERMSAGYVVEHTHRILGFLVGGLSSLVAIGVWCYEPRKALRWAALLALVALLGGFGYFHGEMMTYAKESRPGYPPVSTGLTGVALLAVIGVCIAAVRQSPAGTSVRILAVVTLVAIMIQGLLGGFRVKLNDLVGTDLALIHGTFATLVLSALVAIPLLAARPRQLPPFSAIAQKKLGWQTICLVLFALLQVAFGAWLRHMPDKLSTRLHLLFAFVVMGFATLVIKQALSEPTSKQRLRRPAAIMMALITFQILLGVEAWVGKFLSGEPLETAKVTMGQVMVRTLHAHIGAWIMAVSVAFALLTRRKPHEEVGPAGLVP